VPEGATINDVVAPYGLPPKLVHLVLVNGLFVPPEARADHVLESGDVLAVWPPVAGG
jgi:sulfur carrier protein ThiS